MRFVPINEENKAPAFRFVPLQEQAAPPQGTIPAPPAAAQTSAPVGGEATGTVQRPRWMDAADELMTATALPSTPAAPEQPGFFSQLGQSFGVGIDQGATALSAINATAQDAAIKRTQDRLNQLVTQGQGQSREAIGLQRTLDHYLKRQGGNLASLAQRQADLASAPIYPGVAALGKAPSFGEAWEVLKADPLNIIANLGVQSLPTMAPGLAAGFVNPVLGATVMGASSAGVELGNSLMEFARSNGVNTGSPDELRAFFANPGMLDEAKKFAATRAGIIGTVDALSAGLASKTLVPKAVTSPVARGVTNVAVQIPVQGAAGAGGEAGAQVATEGQITSPGEVVAEGAGGLFTAPVEVASMRAGVRREQALKDQRQAAAGGVDESILDPAALLADAINFNVRRTETNQEGARQAAVDLLSPDRAQMQAGPRFVPLQQPTAQQPLPMPDNMAATPTGSFSEPGQTVQAGPGFTLPNVLAGVGEIPETTQPTNQGATNAATPTSAPVPQQGQEAAQAVTPAATPVAAAPAPADVNPLYAGLSSVIQASAQSGISIAEGRQAVQEYITQNADAFAQDTLAKATSTKSEPDEWTLKTAKRYYEEGRDDDAFAMLASFVSNSNVLGNDAFRLAIKARLMGTAAAPAPAPRPESVAIFNGLIDVMNGQYMGQSQAMKEWQLANGLVEIRNNEPVLSARGQQLIGQLNPTGLGARPITSEQANQIIDQFIASGPVRTVEPLATPVRAAQAPAPVAPVTAAGQAPTDTAEIEPIIEGLPESYAESVRDMYRLVTELGLTNNGQSFAWQPAVRQLKETLASDGEEKAQALLNNTVKAMNERAKNELFTRAGRLYVQQFDEAYKSDAQLIAAIKNGGFSIADQPWANTFYRLNKIDPTKIKAPKAADGVRPGVASFLQKFSAGVFSRPSMATGTTPEGRATAEQMNQQATADYTEATRLFLEGPLDAKVPTGRVDGLEILQPEALTNVQPQPVAKSIPLAKGFEGTLKALSAVVPTKDIRYYLNTIHLNEAKGRIEATDGHRVVLVQEDLTGRIPARPADVTGDVLVTMDGKWAIDPKTNEPMAAKFPDIDRVIPTDPKGRTLTVSFDAVALGDQARGVVKAGKYFNQRTPIPLALEIEGVKSAFNSQYLVDMADVFRRFGYDQFNVSLSVDGKGPMLARSPDGRVTQVIMPMRDEGTFFAPIVGSNPPVTGQPKKAPAKKTTAKKKAVQEFLADQGVTDPAIVDAVADEYDRLTGDEDVQDSDASDGTIAEERGEGQADADAQQPGQQAAQPELFPDLDQGGRSAQDAQSPRVDDAAQASDVNDRATVPAQRDTGATTQDRQGVSRDTGRQENQRIKGAGTDIFSTVSFTNRQSIYKDAWIDLGEDPDAMALLPPERQFNILATGLRNTFGLSVVQRSDRSNIRLSIDQLLDAYRNMQFMAAALDLPTKAIGLNGTLGLGLTSQGKYLGAYYPTGTDGRSSDGLVSPGATIVMPGRSNSFAHEWGHALDFYIAGTFQGAVDNLSGMVRQGESLSDQMPENVRDSFRLLMNSLFFDNAELSARIMDLERRIEAAAQKGIDATKLKADLERVRAGASQSRQGRSEFARSSGEFAVQIGSDPSYWLKPTEMLARSFEAYVAHKVEAIGGTTEFIAKGDDAYMSDADARLAKTFPKDSDRYNIFRAYDLLLDAIREHSLLNRNGDAPATVPANQLIINPMAYYQAQIDSSTSQRVAEAWQAEWQAFQKRSRELERLAARPKDSRTLGQRIMDAPAAVIFTNRGVLMTLEERYRNNGNVQAADAIRNITKRIATDPGAGRETIQGGTYAETVALETTQRLNRLANIVTNNGIDKFTDAQLAELTDVLTSIGTEPLRASPEILKAANELRNLLDSTYYYNMNSKLDIGYVADVGYLPRMLDDPIIMEAGQQFINDAAQVYEIVFERDTMRASDDGVDIGEAINALNTRIKEARLSPKDDTNLQAYVEAIKELRDLQRALNRATAADDADAVDAAQAALNEFIEENMSVFDEAYDYVKTEWAMGAAAEWQSRILYGSPENFSSHSPQGSFTKRRVLPKEADKILAKYYIQNPVERISRYIEASVRKSEYTRLFGNGQLNDQMQALISAKVLPEDQQMIRRIVEQVTGTDDTRIPDRFTRMMSNAHSLGNMTLLGRVVLTSLVEPMTVALQTGRTRDAFLAMAMTIREAFNTKTVREQRAIADLLGIVGGDMTQEIISNRLGGSVGESRMMQRISSQYFRRVGLTGLTNAQRRVSMQLIGRYVMELTADIDDASTSAQRKRFAMDELRDAGLTDAEAQAFVQWTREFRGRLPGIYDLTDPASGELTRMGKLYGLMVGRLVNQAIQNPSAVDRPWAANTVVGRMAYGLLSFSMAFMRNVLIKNFKKVQRVYEAQGAAGAAKVAALQVAAPLTALYMGHLLTTTAREALLNPEKWEEKEKEGELVTWLMQLAFSRAGFTGLADPLYNALLGVKYQRDLANILAGASGSFYLQNLERIARYFVVNSENTNNAERNLVRGLYELLGQTTAAAAVGYLPGGPMLGHGMGLSYAYISSPRAKDTVQDTVAGEKQGSKAKTGQAGRESDNPMR